MDRLTQQDLHELMARQVTPPCLSIYMPTHRLGDQTQQDPLRFRNLLKEAEARLADFGFRGPEAAALLSRADEELRLDEDFWQHQSDGLALFASPDLFLFYRLPLDFEELVVVGERFYLRPLFELFQNEAHFYVLGISREDARLYEGTERSLRVIPFDELTPSFASVIQREYAENLDLQDRQVSRGRQGNTAGPSEVFYHGHGPGDDDADQQVLQYFQRVDHALREMLAGRRIPVVMAGVEYLFPMYRQVNEYPHLMEDGVQGSPEDMRLEDLHGSAWEIVAPHFQREKQEAAGLFQRLAGKNTERASIDLQEIVQAAYGGRVGQLFIPPHGPIWGHYTQAENRIEVHPERRPESEDLLNVAAAYTFANSGVVYIIQDGELPEGTPFAAVMRY